MIGLGAPYREGISAGVNRSVETGPDHGKTDFSNTPVSWAAIANKNETQRMEALLC